MNCQVVSCPGINDGPALDRTLRELGGLYPGGEQRGRRAGGGDPASGRACAPSRPIRRQQAAEVIEQVERFADAFRRRTRHSSGLVLGRVLSALPGGTCRRRAITRTWPSWRTVLGCCACSRVRRRWPWRIWSRMWRHRPFPSPPECPRHPFRRKSLTESGKKVVI